MAADAPENSPFLKQLVSSDKKSRDAAVDSLRTYLLSGKSFSELDLLKLWRGLFFCMWHSDRALTQQRLCNTLSSLVSPLPEELFIPFISAFWKTITSNYSSIDSLRLDKFLLLIRRYINAGFSYLHVRLWEEDLTARYLDVIRDVVNEQVGKVSDGLRYHVLDCWVEELSSVDRDGDAPVERILSVVKDVSETGRTKVLRQHAKGVLKDERLQDWKGSRGNGEVRQADESVDGYEG